MEDMTAIEGLRRHKRPSEEATHLYAFSAKVENINGFASILRTIYFTDKVNVLISNSGIRFTVEEGKVIQASVFFQKSVFQEFSLRRDSVEFKIPLKEMMNCLKVFYSDHNVGSETLGELPQNVSMKIMFEGSLGSPFVILLEENGAIIDFQLMTNEIEELIDFSSVETKGKLNLKSEPMRELLTEMDSNSPESAEFKIFHNNRLEILCSGVSGAMKILIREESEIVENFESQADCFATYKFALLKHTFTALKLSQTFTLRISPEGILSLSFTMPARCESCVEFNCLSMIMDETADSIII